MKLNHPILVSAAAVLGLSLPVIAGAQVHVTATHRETGPYVGALVGYSSIDVGLTEWNSALAKLPVPSGSTITSSSVSKGDFAWGVNAGYQVMENFAVEIGYLDLGKTKGDVTGTIGGAPATGRGDIKSSGVEGALIGIWPFENGWQVDARVGLYYGDNKVQLNGSTGTGSASYENSGNKSTFLGGVGFGYNFYDNYQVRFDYVYIDKIGDAGKLGFTAPVDLFSVGFRYSF